MQTSENYSNKTYKASNKPVGLKFNLFEGWRVTITEEKRFNSTPPMIRPPHPKKMNKKIFETI